MFTPTIDKIPETQAPPAVDTLEVVVSLADISEGVQGDMYECAVARALGRAGHTKVIVDRKTVTVAGHVYVASDDLIQWLKTFDRNHRWVHPDRWVLRAVQS